MQFNALLLAVLLFFSCGVGILPAPLFHRHLASEDKLLNTVAFACTIFDQVLRVHPYANGNGHAARFIIWAIFR